MALAERNDGVDYRADLYALGATLFRLLTGRAPPAESPKMTLLEKVRLIGSQSAPVLSSLRSDAPVGLVQLMSSLLSRELSGRPANAAHVAAAIEPFCDGHRLKELFQQAEAIVQQEAATQPDDMAQLPPAQPTPTAPPAPRTRYRGWVMTAATLPLLLLAGVLVTLELSKGQLVIQFDAADVHVKLRRDNTIVKELTIQPGATSTRLAADKYEIIIDAPSDQITVDQGSFVVRNGQTIVANIRQSGKASAVSDAPKGTESSALDLNTVMKHALSVPAVKPTEETTVTNQGLEDNSQRSEGWRHQLQDQTASVEIELSLDGKTLADWLTALLTDDIEQKLLALRAIDKISGSVGVRGILSQKTCDKAAKALVASLKQKGANTIDNYDLYQFLKSDFGQAAFAMLEKLTDGHYLVLQLQSGDEQWRRMIFAYETIQAEKNVPKIFIDKAAAPKAMLNADVAKQAINVLSNENDQDKLLAEAAADYLLPFAGKPLAKQLAMVKVNYENDPAHPMLQDPNQFLESSAKLTTDYWLSKNCSRLTPRAQLTQLRKARETFADVSSRPESVLLAMCVFYESDQQQLETPLTERLNLLSDQKDRLSQVYRIISRENGTFKVEPWNDWVPDPGEFALPFAHEYYMLLRLSLLSDLRREAMAPLREAIAKTIGTLDSLLGDDKDYFTVEVVPN